MMDESQHELERIIDYLYGELSPAEEAEVRRRIETEPDWRAEHDRLKAVMAELDRIGDVEVPSALTDQVEAELAREGLLTEATPMPRRRGWPVFARVASIAASVLMAATAAFLLLRGTPPVAAGDVEVVPERVAVTVFNDNLALVKDRRFLVNCPRGEVMVRFTNVAARIIPDSVRFESLTDLAGTRVVEQNYEYDLASPNALLKRYIDRHIRCLGRDGTLTEGRLMSFDQPSNGSGQLVLKLADGRAANIARKQLESVQLGRMPEGLLTRPTLMWKLRAKRAGRNEMVLSYLTEGMSWHADYVAVLTGKDTLSLAGWVTITNASGSTYPNADLKLIAGDVHRVREDKPRERLKEWEGADGANRVEKKQFEEKGFFEYHLYTLQRRTMLKDKQTKQIKLMSADGVKFVKRYILDTAWSTERVAVELEFKNEKANALGIPLPKGRVRVRRADVDGELQEITQENIDHTPKDEKVKLRAGCAFDVVGERTQTDFSRTGRGRVSFTGYQVRLRNHTDEALQVHVRDHFGGSWRITQQDHPGKATDAFTYEFIVDLKPNEAKTIHYTVRRN